MRVIPGFIPSSVANYVEPFAPGYGIRLPGSASGAFRLKPAAAAGSVEFTAPVIDGSSGDSLVTNASGVLSFSSRLSQAAADALYAAIGHTHTGVYSPVGHAHAASDITSATMATARLGSGAADGTVFLRGDSTWAAAGVTDHGALTGLSDDDHSIYALLAGRTGGQTLNGGTAIGDFLRLGNAGGHVSVGTATTKLSTLTVTKRADTVATGTTSANAATTITGSGTAFLTDVGLGDRISLSSAASTFGTVTDIASNTSLTVDTAIGNGTSQTINVKHAIFRVDSSIGVPLFMINDNGGMALGAGLVAPVTGGNLAITAMNSDTFRDANGNGFIIFSGATPNRNVNIGNTGIYTYNWTGKAVEATLNATLIGVWTTPDAGAVPFTVKGKASQTANLFEWQSSAAAVYSTISENGYFTTRKVAAPADAEIATSEVAWWFDNTNGAARLVAKGKTANGTVVTGSFALA